MQQFINSAIAYAKANPLFVYILAACVLVMLVTLIAVAVVSGKNKKAKKLAAAQAVQTLAKEEPTVKAEPAPVKEEAIVAKEEPVAKEEATVKAEPVPVKEEPSAVKETPAPVEEVKLEKTPKATQEKKPAEKAPKTQTVKKAKETPAKTQAAEKPAPAKATAAKKPSNRYAGKWLICHLILEDTNGKAKEEAYFFELHASNGELLLSSEEYTSYSGAVAGIETHKNNVEKGNFKITLSKKGDYIFKLLNGKNTLLCTGANYPTEQRAESAVESTKRFAKTAVLQESMEELRVRIPIEEEEEEPEYDESIVGKWVVNAKSDANGNKVYYFELFASNGEKLLSSEEYTTYVGAVNGISTHKTNIEKGNFRISVTKRGEYIFKLLSGNGQLLCLGEHYKTRGRCESAIESVKRFAKCSPMLTSSTIQD